MSDLISIIVPCYNEESSLPYFYKEICTVFSSMEHNQSVNFELLFINDGSNDNTFSLIKNFALKDQRIKYISFSRNFGKEGAIIAGLEHAKGDYIAMMDADLQDPPAGQAALFQELGLKIDPAVDAVAAHTEVDAHVIHLFYHREIGGLYRIQAGLFVRRQVVDPVGMGHGAVGDSDPGAQVRHALDLLIGGQGGMFQTAHPDIQAQVDTGAPMDVGSGIFAHHLGLLHGGAGL